MEQTPLFRVGDKVNVRETPAIMEVLECYRIQTRSKRWVPVYRLRWLGGNEAQMVYGEGELSRYDGGEDSKEQAE